MAAGLNNNAAFEAKVVMKFDKLRECGVWWGVAAVFGVGELRRWPKYMAVSIPRTNRQGLNRLGGE
ncbi:hypothetical protein BR1R5_05900 [Pseudomonas sp. BR1R-5]|nr:hypothetical protein BR1R5_05900 [Pseudomonas sp. BR1R-5]